MPDFCILPDQSNSLLNFLHFLLLSYIFLVFQFIFLTFSQLTFNICPIYRHFNFSGRGDGGQLPHTPMIITFFICTLTAINLSLTLITYTTVFFISPRNTMPTPFPFSCLELSTSIFLTIISAISIPFPVSVDTFKVAAIKLLLLLFLGPFA